MQFHLNGFRTGDPAVLEAVPNASQSDVVDVLIVGCGPAGLSAGLSAMHHKLRYKLIEQEDSLGGAVYHYPRQKIAMTAPVVQTANRGQSIAMTAPVVQTARGDHWTVRFIMPGAWTLETLPTPNDARVHLVPVPPSRMAVVRFSGLARPDEVARRTATLRAFIAGHHLHETGAPDLARYDPPWTPWFMRRNEVMIPVAAA